jgi:hypothetical protein
MPAYIGGLSNSQGRPMTTRNDLRIFDRFDARAQIIRHRDAADCGQFLVSDHAWRDVCPFAFVELENGLVAGGSAGQAQLLPIEGCDWPGRSRKT